MNDFGWAKLISVLNFPSVIFVAIVGLLGAHPDRHESFIRFLMGLPINWKQSIQRQCSNLQEEGSSVPYYLEHPLCFLIYLLEGYSLSRGSEQGNLAQLGFLLYLLVGGLGPHLLDRLGIVEEHTIRHACSVLSYTLLYVSFRLQKPIKPQRNPEELFAASASICHKKIPTPARRPSPEHPQQHENDTPKPSNQTVAGPCGREELTLHDQMSSSQHPQQQQNDIPKPSKQIVAGAFEREELTLQHKTDLDHNTKNFCGIDQEKCTNEHERTSSEHWQEQKQESHHPKPNTPTREPRTRRWKRYNPDTQTTPQDTHERSKRHRVSNDQRKSHFYMDSGAAYHSTFDPSVINCYPAHLKPPVQAIQGFGGSTILVIGYGYIDGPGGKLKDVLLLPDSTANLMCLGQLTRDYPVKVVFYKDKFWIEGLHNGERVGEGHREDVNHYVVDRFQPDSLLINKRKPCKKKARHTR